MIQRIFGRKKKGTDTPKTGKSEEQSSLGKVLVRLHLLTDDQLSKVVAHAGEDEDRKVGEAACALGFCKPEDVEQALIIQADMRGNREGVAALAFLRSGAEQMMANASELETRVKAIKRSPTRRIALKRS